jgi:hypothetical protein
MPPVSAAQPVSSSGAAVRMAPVTNSSSAAVGASPAIPPAATAKPAASDASRDVESGNGREPASSAASVSVTAPTLSPTSVAAVAPASAAGAASTVATRAAEVPTNGIGSAQVDAIKAALHGQKFLWSMLDAVTRWEVENGELRLFFPSESRSLAEMLQARDPMERLRTVLNQVVGQPLRVCVKLDSSRATAPAGRSSELRARFEEDPIVRAMLEKFGGQISNVKRPGEE